MSTGTYVQISLTFLMVLAVVLPLVRNNYWVFRILEYPRFQKFILCIVLMLSWCANTGAGTAFHVAAGSMVLCSLYLLYKILPYTALSRKEMKTVRGGKKKSRLKLFTANVYEKNRDYLKLLGQVESCDPDIIFLVETDEKWQQGVSSLVARYPHQLTKPLSNTYGLLLFSRFELLRSEVKFLVENDVPSVDFVVSLPSGEQVRMWGLHPKPPVPGEDERTTAKDKELLKVAEMAAKSELPVVVMGDLNDVAWSYTTELFRKTSHLLDPRRGRGFYSTYNAKNFFMRFPLDYVFCSNDFGLVAMKRLPKNGSDHFAMFIHLQYDVSLKAVQKTPKADEEEHQRAEEKKRESHS